MHNGRYRRRKKSNGGGGHSESADRYLITYADLITLLLGLFVILYATSQVDAAKFKDFSQAFNRYFTASGDGAGGDGILPAGSGLLPALNPQVRNDGDQSPEEREKSLDQIAAELRDSLADQIQASFAVLEHNKDGIVLRLNEKLLFESGKAELKTKALQSLEAVAGVLRGVGKQVEISGHTDSDSIRTFQYESNWQLSIARATNVAYYLSQRIPDDHLTILGCADKDPVASNLDEFGKAQNRRVEFKIRDLPPNVPSTELYDPPPAF